MSTLKGRVAAAFEYILSSLTEDPKGLVSFKSVQKTIGVTDGSNFRKTIRQHEDFIDRIAQEGIIEHGHGKYSTGFAMNFEVLFGSRVAA